MSITPEDRALLPNSLVTAGRVVVGTDLSHPANRALEWAARRAVGRHPLLLVMVMPGLPLPRRGQITRSMRAGTWLSELTDRAEQELTHERDRVLALFPSVEIETALIEGEPSAVLAGATLDAQLVVLAARGRHAPVGVRWLGGTTDSVVTHARGPVAVVTDLPGANPRGPVIVGVDDRPEAAAALRIGVEEALGNDVELVALHALDLDPWVALSAGTFDPEEIQHPVLEAVEAMLAPIRAEHPRLPVTTQVVLGRAAESLIEASVGASLVVVGSRGRGGFTGMLLGSTSKSVLRAAHCPVVVTRA